MKKNTILMLSFLILLNACVTKSPQGARVRPMGSNPSEPASPSSLPKGEPLDADINTPQPNEVGFLNQNPNTNAEFQEPSHKKNQITPPKNTISSPAANTVVKENQTDNDDSTNTPKNKVASAAPAPVGNEAVKTLLADARSAVNQNNLSKAASALDRAVIIEPNNASIWYDLAQIRLHQGQYKTAESLAQKSISLSSGNNVLVKRNWAVIAASKDARGDKSGAEEAKRRSQ